MKTKTLWYRFVTVIQIVLTVILTICVSYNVDIKSARIIRGQNRTGFGYSAEIVEFRSRQARLIVTAPKEEVPSRFESGIHYLCDFTDSSNSCIRRFTPPYNISRRPPIASQFEEEHEMFGMTLIKINQRRTLACGPLWTDLEHWNFDYIFPIGRCNLLDSDSSASSSFIPYHNSTFYIGDISVEGLISKQWKWGLALFGSSAASDGQGKFVVAAPGYSASRGGWVYYDTNTGSQLMMTQILDDEPDNYLGTSMAAGNFCGQNEFCFAISGRKPVSKVFLMQKVNSSFEILETFPKDQQVSSYSNFGHSLCAVDVNGDGWSDLLVGAPTYSVNTTQPPSYDEGRVFVYLALGMISRGQNNFKETASLSGSQKKFSRFGVAVSGIGDINMDSYQDVAVGAPQEDDGVGAIYIYLGGAEGLKPRHSQRISGSDFKPTMFSFGSHFSLPTYLTSDYNYPDFVVGCPESDAVVFLRTSLIVNVQVSLKANPNSTEPSNKECPPDLDMTGLRASGCFVIQACFRLNSSSPGSVGNNLTLDYRLELDTLVQNEASKRARLYQPLEKNTLVELRSNISARWETSTCVNFTAILREEQISWNPFRPVQISLAFSLNTSMFTNTVAPILNESMPSTAQTEVKFKNKCGEDEVCQTDLKLTGQLLHVPQALPADYNIINRTNEVTLDLQLVNQRETAFGTHLTVFVHGNLAFRTALALGGEEGWRSHFNCTTKPDPMGSLLTCVNWARLAENEDLKVSLHFQATSVPIEERYRETVLEVRALPYDTVENPEVNPADNMISLKSKLAIIADLLVGGSADPRSLHVQDFRSRTLSLSHKLLLTNRGPSFLPNTHVNISLPSFEFSSRKELLTNYTVMIKFENETTIECPLISSSGVVLETTTLTSISPSTHTTPTDLTTSFLEPNSTTPPDGFVVPESNRRRRQAEQQSADCNRNKNSPRELWMDCANYHCQVFRCPLPDLQPKKHADISVNLQLLRTSLPFSDKIDRVCFVTQTAVAQPQHPLFYPWTKPEIVEEVSTAIYNLSSREDINIWIVIGGVLAGIILIIIIACIAYKLGFFRRKDKDKLERLKRQSGFYNRASTKSKGSRASSTNSAAKP